MTRTPARAIRLLIVDHSPAARERLRRLFDDVPDIDVVGEAGTVEKALRLLEDVSPTAVLVDCDLPEPGSFAAVSEMMSLYPVPIVMVTKQGKASAAEPSRARLWRRGRSRLSPGPRETPAPAQSGDADLVRTVRAMSEVKVVRRRGPRSRAAPPAPAATASAAPVAAAASAPRFATTAATTPRPDPRPPASAGGRIEIVAIGASTGGPPVLQTILGGLSRPFPVPIVLVQHLSRGFQNSLVAWLADVDRRPHQGGRARHASRVPASSTSLPTTGTWPWTPPAAWC